MDEKTHRALVADYKDDSVSFIDLREKSMIRTIDVGRGPVDVAIDNALGLAVVVNNRDSSIALIDLNTYGVKDVIPAGQNPVAVAVDTKRHVAAIVNGTDDTVSVVHLISMNSYALPACKHPTDVAINPLNGHALILCDGDRRLVVMDLAARVIKAEYPMDKKPYSCAINEFMNTVVATDYVTDTLTIIRLPNPVPSITETTPSSLSAAATRRRF
ncbi:MAG: hypothetical protein M0C28_16980 [Candidatus Moduliflexus flocculans]|nr:hypothetical protein [Candidatus Moduliflexus flocculans]